MTVFDALEHLKKIGQNPQNGHDRKLILSLIEFGETEKDLKPSEKKLIQRVLVGNGLVTVEDYQKLVKVYRQEEKLSKIPAKWLVYASYLLETEPEPVQWLVNGLWTANSCGIIGGEPKAYKSWLAMEMAIGISSGCSVLGKFEVPEAGNVIYVAEETRTSEMRRHLSELVTGKGLAKHTLNNLYVAVQRRVMLDNLEWQDHIKKTLGLLKPKALILDPYVRMQSADENDAQAQQPVLRFLRGLQAEFGCSVIVVHHMRKSSPNDNAREGQRLRGSSDLHAWVDCGIYLDRAKKDNKSGVTVEFRDAEAPEQFVISLTSNETNVWLQASTGTLEESKLIQDAAPIIEFVKANGEALNSDIMPLMRGTKQHRMKIYAMLENLLEKTMEERPTKSGKVRDQVVWKQKFTT